MVSMCVHPRGSCAVCCPEQALCNATFIFIEPYRSLQTRFKKPENRRLRAHGL